MAVQVIKATKQRTAQAATQGQGELLRVAAYCRVSSESDQQETSYEAQCQHYTSFINGHEGWCLAGIYADEGISGTSLKRREQFNQMITDCEAGLIDLVITKSISRWARNTLDSLQTIRKLKSLGIPIIFEKESINTMDANGEILITIMSSLAQQESESISRNVRMGIQYRFQQGKGRLNTAQFLGLTRDPESKTLVIIPEEAALVRRIYREYLEGYSPGMIAAHLTKDQILTPAGKETWYQSTVISILQNEKYCGDLLLQKYYVADFLNHKIVKNEGDLPQYFVEDAHEPIIPKDVFYQVQGEMQRRSLLKYDPSKIRYGSTDALKGRLICGHCGRVLKRYTGPGLVEWRCRKRNYEKQSLTKESKAACPCRNVAEEDVKSVILEAFNSLPARRDDLLRMQGALWDGQIRRLDQELESLSEERKRLEDQIDELMDDDHTAVNGVADEKELRARLDRLETEYTRLVMERAEAANKDVQVRVLLELIGIMTEDEDSDIEREDGSKDAACYDYEEFFKRTRYEPEDSIIVDSRVVEFEQGMIVRYLESVIVNDQYYEVKFKAGLTVKLPIPTI